MFWKHPNTMEPLRQHRWLLSNGVVWVWAKSVKLPAYTVETQKYQIGNHRLNYPGLLEWQDVTMTIVDIAGPFAEISDINVAPRSLGLFNQLKAIGYNIESNSNGISKDGMFASIKAIFGQGSSNFQIQQIDSDGKLLQQWTLYSALIKDVSFGQLDYSSDELITIDLTIAYDYAKLEQEV